MEELAGKHVIILGKGQSGLICPFDADELWGVNNVAAQKEYEGKKFHKLFAFDGALEEEYIAGMKQFAPVMSWQKWADIHFPLDEVVKEFDTTYFTNTISYMLAYAIYCKVSKVSIYGVDASFGAPYAQENRGIEYWLGRAKERGIDCFVPEKSQLLRTVYGNLYGEIGACNMLLYLHERINLINVLPKEGSYSEALKAQNAWWVLFPKEDEAKIHNVTVQRLPDGNLNFQAAKEYVSDIQMAPEVWDYLKGVLVNLEKTSKLPFSVLSAYEKIVLGKENPHSKVGEGN